MSAMNSEARKRWEERVASGTANWDPKPNYRVVYWHEFDEADHQLVGKFVRETMNFYEFEVPHDITEKPVTIRVQREGVREIWSTTAKVHYPTRVPTEERML